MKILVANLGSTSLKWRLFDFSTSPERMLHKGGFDGRDVAAEKSSDVAAADFFPASKGDVRRFKGGVTRFEQSTEAFAFNHSNCLLSHKISFVFGVLSFGLFLWRAVVANERR